MSLRKLRLAAVAASLLLAGCTVIRHDPAQTRIQIAADLQIPESAILRQEPVQYAIATRDSTTADFKLGIFTLTQRTLSLHRYSEAGSPMARDIVLPVERMQGSLAGSFGMFKNLHQLQIFTDLGLIAVNFADNTDKISGDEKTTRDAQAELTRLGVPVATGSAFVMQSSSGGMIPIFLPAK
jgi:hypothetical protein